MYRKNCYRCYRSSYSSSNNGCWTCSYCSKDLSAQRAFEAMIQKQINHSPHLKKQAISAYEKNNLYK